MSDGGLQPGLMAEQVAYYRAHAPEYDQWRQRVGRYDQGAAHTASWRAEVDEVVDWLEGARAGR